MTLRKLFLATAFGICLASSTQAQEPSKMKLTDVAPTKTTVSNQDLADSVANRLRASGLGSGASIHINTKGGMVELTGTVPNRQHSDSVVQAIANVPGVTKIVNTMQIGYTAQLTPVSAEPSPFSLVNGGMPAMGGMSAPMMPMMGGAMGGEPMPMAGPANPGYDPYGPKLPPYSWPTYAPYPNVSRVAYPESYPYNAFPFIGPFYPYPKVPLGWRSVKLEWEDGHWYYGKISTPHDYWRVRFW